LLRAIIQTLRNSHMFLSGVFRAFRAIFSLSSLSGPREAIFD
jgi:hypothetical protein